MADNQQVSNPPLGTYQVRTIEKSGQNVQSIVLDIGGSGTESLLSSSNPLPTSTASVSNVTETTANVTTSSSTILTSNVTRKAGYVYNISDTTIYISFGSTATTNKIPVSPGGFLTFNCAGINYTGAINAIHAATGTKTVFIQWC